MLIGVKPSDGGYDGNLKLLSELLHDADMKLFRSMLHRTHYIHQLLPALKFMPMKLRISHCAFVLPYCHYNLYKHSFVLRVYDVYLMQHIKCFCCCFCGYSLFSFFLYFFSVMLY